VKFGYDRRRGEEGGSDSMAKWLIIIGIVLFVLGIAWPLLAKLGLGDLPGDIKLERKDYTFYFPVTTSILISLVITLVLWIFRR
jgi:uncharacterized membrane protein